MFKKFLRALKKQWYIRQYLDCKSRFEYHEAQMKYFTEFPSGNHLEYHTAESQHYAMKMIDINDRIREIDTDKW